jgi:hypothetical protein
VAAGTALADSGAWHALRVQEAAEMLTFDTTTALVTLALTAPFWWGMGLLLLALLAELTPEARARVSRLFDRLERMDAVPRAQAGE